LDRALNYEQARRTRRRKCKTDIKIGFSTINARAEEVDTKPAFREAFRQRRVWSLENGKIPTWSP